MTFKAKIFNRLSEISNLSVFWIYKNDISVTDKYCVVDILDGSVVNYANYTTSTYKRAHLAFNIFAKDSDDLDLLVKAVFAKINRYNVVDSNLTIDDSYYLNITTDFDKENMLYLCTLEFELIYSE